MYVPLCHEHHKEYHRQGMGILIPLGSLWKYQPSFPCDRTWSPLWSTVPLNLEVSWTVPLNSQNVINWGFIIYPKWVQEIHKIRTGTSLCILQRYVPLWSCDGNNSSESKGEDLSHSNMLQSCKGRITWPDSIIWGDYAKIREKSGKKSYDSSLFR